MTSSFKCRFSSLFCLSDSQREFLFFINMGFCCSKVCRKWKGLASDNNLWSNLFRERWGGDNAMFYAPVGSKSWKDVYEIQDRCHRVGL